MPIFSSRSSVRKVTIMTLVVSCVLPLFAQAQSTLVFRKFNPYVVVLGDPDCGSGSSSSEKGTWRQTTGPSGSLILHNNNRFPERSYAKFFETGLYTFRTTCSCSGGETSAQTTTTTQSTQLATVQPNNNQGLSRISLLMSSGDRVGYGSRTTGGAAATRYTVVTSLADSGRGTLREAVKDQNGPTWVVFDQSISGGTIQLRDTLQFNKPGITIDGAGSGITIAAPRNSRDPALTFRGGNTIVHGLTLDGRGGSGAALMLREGDDYWIDHVTITNFHGDDGVTIGQGSRGSSSTSDVTISNYHAHNTNFAILGGGENIPNYPPYRVTIHSSILSAEDRNPRINNYGTAHIFNNYIHSFRFSALSATGNSRIFSENNVFSSLSANNPNMALSGITLNGNTPGQVFSRGDLLLGEASTTGQVRQSTSFSGIPYRYTVKPANQVVDYVSVYAGAAGAALKLRNTADAVVSRQSTATVNVSANTTSTTSASCGANTVRVNYTRLPPQ